MKCLLHFGYTGQLEPFCKGLPLGDTIYKIKPEANNRWINSCSCSECLRAIFKDERAGIVHELVSARLITLEFEKDFVVLLEEEKKN